MGKAGACGGTTLPRGMHLASQSLFSRAQSNVLDALHWVTRQDRRMAIVTWIERTYHRRRRQRCLGRFTPVEYETIVNPAIDLAAYAMNQQDLQQSPSGKGH